MVKKLKTRDSTLSEELLELIRIKPEDTEAFIARQKYKIHERPDEQAPRGKYWCCYCGAWRKFGKSKKNPELFDYPRCSNCNISLEDWYIKYHNKLFESTKKEKRK